MRIIIFAIAVLLLALPLGCSSAPKATKNSGQSLSGTDEQIFLGDTIEKNYDPNVIIKRAESFFDKEEYAEAVIEYQHFLELHRVHALAPYAQFKLGESYFKQIKSVDRDSDPVYKSLETYEKLRKDWPGTRWDGDAQERIQSCHNTIAQNYLLVGHFYFRREAYLAAAHRYEAVLKLYPELDVAADALYHLAVTYNELGADDWARERLIAFTEQYPKHAEVGAGRRLLAQINAKTGTTAVAAEPSVPSSRIAAYSTNGTAPVPTASVPTLNSVTSLRSSASATSTSQNGKLCRLGVWC